MNAERSVSIGCDILNSALKFESYPGLFKAMLFSTDIYNTMSIGGLFIAGP